MMNVKICGVNEEIIKLLEDLDKTEKAIEFDIQVMMSEIRSM